MRDEVIESNVSAVVSGDPLKILELMVGAESFYRRGDQVHFVPGALRTLLRKSRRARALAVTIQVSRHRKHDNFGC